SFLPFSGTGAATNFTIQGRPPFPDGHRPVVDVRIVDNGYFRTMNIPLIRGRFFTEREVTEQSNVVIISDVMARLYFAGEDPIGQRVTIFMREPNVPTEIIGVVGDVKYVDLTTPSRPMAYWPHPQLIMGVMTLTVKTASSNPLEVVPLLVHEIQIFDKN